MFARQIQDVGLHPILGTVIVAFVWVIGIEYAYYKSELTTYLILLVALSLFGRASEKRRNDFLLSTFGSKKKSSIRMIENLILSFPPLIMLMIHEAWIESLITLLFSVFFALISVNSSFNLTFPTPFSKRPFEYAVGFRNTFFLFPVIYAFTGFSIYIKNLNLGIFTLLLILLICSSYFIKPENEYFVWSHSKSSKKFLFHKLFMASKNAILLSLPIYLCLISFNWDEVIFISVFFLLGMIFLWTVVLGKYSAYPREMNLPEGILIGVCLFFPPLLLLLLPYFFKKSSHQLKSILP